MSDFETQATSSVEATGKPGAEDRQWAMFGHLSALIGLFTGGIGNIVGPLVIWLVKKDTLPFAGEQAKEALNFNITLLIAAVALVLVTVVTFGIGIILTGPIGALLGLAWLVLTILAGVKANEGVAYRYPFTLRLIK
ncbi:MAG: DUF4870 domain-containing protein [Pseudoxanthomonas sp.]|nr:DUF4870 domain-containing protein [Pseudoxanthomonas sp.]